MKKQAVFMSVLVGVVIVIVYSVWYVRINQESASKSSFLYPTPTPKIQKNYPANIIDLTNWKLTVPTGNAEHPTEIKQPGLATYVLDPWFVLTPNYDGIRFRAPVSAVTTSGSNYPRSELREMTNVGRTNASWSSTQGNHTMRVDEAITAVPRIKQHVVAGQIHDASDDIIVIRLEMPHLYVNVNGKNIYTLDDQYTLGKRFSFRFEVSDGKTNVYYNDSPKPVYTLFRNYSGAYFKAGVYTQSNCIREKNPTYCTQENYGEVIIYSVDISHK